MESEVVVDAQSNTEIEVVKGICDLLMMKKHTDIIRYTIKACTYISMNYKFINDSKFSLNIL